MKVVADGKDPSATKAAERGPGDGRTVTIGANDSIEDDVRAPGAAAAGDRRMKLVGIVAQADIARNYDKGKIGDLVEAISR